MENIKHCYIAIGLLYLSNQEKKQQSLRFKFMEVKSRLLLRTTNSYFAEFAVAE